jgi:poly(beta-D-mannuronate) lyase
MWKVTLPLGVEGKPLEIKQPALQSYSHPLYFYVNENNGVVFNAPCGAVTTINSNYPRSELRERDPVKNIDIAWSAASGIHEMYNVLQVTQIPVVKPELSIVQIHDANDDVMQVLVSRNVLLVRGARFYGNLDENFKLGSIFKIKTLVQGGFVNIFYNDMDTPKVKFAYTGGGNYFKVGAYTQSNLSKGDAADAAGEVVVYETYVKHS